MLAAFCNFFGTEKVAAGQRYAAVFAFFIAREIPLIHTLGKVSNFFLTEFYVMSPVFRWVLSVL